MDKQMFAREWRCRVAQKNNECFIDYLYEVGVKDIASAPGFRGAQIFRRKSGEQVEITLITYWDKLATIESGQDRAICASQGCAGEEFIEMGPNLTVRHYEVLDQVFAPHAD